MLGGHDQSLVAWARATDRLVDHPLSDGGESGVLVLTQHAQFGECLVGATPRPAPKDPNGLVDDGSTRQCCLHLSRQCHCLREDLCVVHRDRGGRGKELAHMRGMVVEDVLGAAINVDRPDHAIRKQQREGQDAVHTQPTDPGSEVRPPLFTTQRS